MRVLIFFLLIISVCAFGRTSTTTPLLVGDAAEMTGSKTAVYETLIRSELEGWRDVRTGSTIQLENQCQVGMEFHLAGNHRTNLLLLGVTNSSGESISIKYRDIRFIYDGNIVRYPVLNQNMSNRGIGPNWWQITWIPFSSKEEFKDIKDIKVQIPIIKDTSGKSCVVESQFKRRELVAADVMSYSALEINFDFGPALTQIGNVQELGKPNFMGAVEFNYYPRAHYGFGMMVSRESVFIGNNPNLDQKFNGTGNHEASASYIGLQYIYRHYFQQKLFLSFGIGPGVQYLQDEKSGLRKNREVATDFAIADKFMLNWVFSSFHTHESDRVDFYVGAGVGHFWVPRSSVGGQDLSGHRLSGLFRIGMGL